MRREPNSTSNPTPPRGRREAGRVVGVAFVMALALAACATAPQQPQAPPIDAGQVAGAAANASTIDAPYRLVFEWRATEPGSRLEGRGVARIAPPANARLDLFATNGEHIAAAALVGDELRVAANAQTEIPQPPLLWAALGVFRPGTGSGLAGGRWHGNGVAELRYLSPDGGEIRYTLAGDRIDRVDVSNEGRARIEVRLSRSEGERFPREATYRDLEDVRELTIRLESVEHVESYPTDIWDPGA